MTHWPKPAILFLILVLFTATAYATPAPVAQITVHPHSLQTNPLSTLKIESITNLGVPAGNAATPRHLALNSSAGLLYILSEGEPLPEQGNVVAVFDIERDTIIERLKINHGDTEPLDLQFDPESGLLYALWKERYGTTRPILSIIDSKGLQVVQEVPDVESFTVKNSLLYTANATQMARVNPSNNSMKQAQRVDLPPATISGPMAVSLQNNRLYLARNLDSGWTIEIFEAGTMTPLTSYATDAQVLDIFPVPATDQVLFTTGTNNFRVLNRITSNGQLADLPYELGPYYGAAAVALTPNGETLYYSNGQYSPTGPNDPSPGPALAGLHSATLNQTHDIPLLNNVDDLAIDDDTQQAFAVYPYDHHIYIIDLNDQSYQVANTVIQIRDVLVDAKTNRIFISDSANRVRQLEYDSLQLLAETTLQNNRADYGFKAASWSGELALDADRNRLYVSGLPATVLKADTLNEITPLEPGGQMVPDSNNSIYVTHCGVTILDADTLTGTATLPGSTPRTDDLVPNPCAEYSRLDAKNQRLYSIVPNGIPGSNGGSYLYAYNLSPKPTLIFSDTNRSTTSVETDPTGDRVFVSYIQHSNRRLRTLKVTDSQYKNQLMGVWGPTRYSPATNHLYLGDSSQKRILTLNGDTLSVIDSLPLPENDNFQLNAIDPATDRLYLAGSNGNLLIAAPGKRGPEQAEFLPAAPAREANGAIFNLFNPASDNLFAKIESRFGDFSSTTQLFGNNAAGKSRENLTKNLPPYPTHAIAVSPNFEQDNTLFASLMIPGQTGGLFKSINGGQSWQPAMTGLQDLWVDRLFISPMFGTTGLIIADTIYGGLHISTDGGETWEPLIKLDPNAQFPNAGTEFSAAFDAKNNILVSQNLDEMRGIFRASVNDKKNLSPWKAVFDIPVTHLALGPNGQTALAFGQALWRSVDGGQHWEIGGSGLTGLDNLQPDQIIFSPDFEQDQTVYFFFKSASSSNSGILFRSIDGGQTWQPWQTPNPNKLFTAIALTPNGDFLLGDAGTQLTQLSPATVQWLTSPLPTTRFPINDVAIFSNYSSDQTLFAVSGQHGLFKSTNGGRGWQPTSFAARTHTYSSPRYRLAISPNFSVDHTLFVATGLSLHRTTNGGQSWQQLLPPNSAPFQALKIAVSPNFGQDQTLLVSTPTTIYRSTNGGDTWQPVLASGAETTASDLLTFAPNGQTAYARFSYGQNLYRSTDGGQNWDAVPANRDEFFSIISAQTNSDNMLSAALEYDRKLLQTGPQISPWNDATETLPAELTNLNVVTHHPNGTFYIAGQGGIFSSADNGQSWQGESDFGLPRNANIMELKITGNHFVVTLNDGAIFSKESGNSWKDISIIK